jgi:pimeloyl-ACP methyl ester carboxylesterase
MAERITALEKDLPIESKRPSSRSTYTGTIRINHRDLHMERYGDPGAPTLILLHHGLGSTRAWRDQIFAFTAAGYHLVVYDRWGYGCSDPRPHLAVPGFEDDLTDLQALIAAIDPPSLALIGHSDGGTIALYQAIQYPATVSAMVIVAAHIYLEPKMEPGIQGIRWAFENQESFRKGMARAHGEKFESTFTNWFEGWHNPLALEWDMRPLLKKIYCPVLVIQGEEDEHASSQQAIDLSENIPKSKLWLQPEAKHMLPQNMPETFNARVLSFLAEFFPPK